MKLYYAPRTRAFRPRWLLEELGLEHELITLDFSQHEHKSPHYRRFHPLGKVPCLVDGDLTLIESTAICLYLADTYGDGKLAPSMGSPERALYYQSLLYSSCTVEPMIAPVHARGLRNRESRRRDTSTREERSTLGEILRPLESRLLKQRFIVSDEFSAADVVFGGVLLWADEVGLLADLEELSAYLGALQRRQAFAKATT